MYCYKCGTQAMAPAQWCHQCGTKLGPSMQGDVLLVRTGKNAGVAAVLSALWCGLGQIYNGEIAKGLIFVVLHFVSILAMVILIGWLTTPVLWVWGMVDAYQTCERLNREAGLT
jgi:TM2 domain-containing membrane protein YozV